MDHPSSAPKNGQPGAVARPGVKVRLVEDDATSSQALREALLRHRDGVAVETCPSALDAQGRIARTEYDVVISDVRAPGMEGLARLARTRRLRPQTPTLLVTWN